MRTIKIYKIGHFNHSLEIYRLKEWTSKCFTIVSANTVRGKQVMENTFRNQNKVELDISKLTKGIYFIRVQTDNCIETKKLLIQ